MGRERGALPNLRSRFGLPGLLKESSAKWKSQLRDLWETN